MGTVTQQRGYTMRPYQAAPEYGERQLRAARQHAIEHGDAALYAQADGALVAKSLRTHQTERDPVPGWLISQLGGKRDSMVSLSPKFVTTQHLMTALALRMYWQKEVISLSGVDYLGARTSASGLPRGLEGLVDALKRGRGAQDAGRQQMATPRLVRLIEAVISGQKSVRAVEGAIKMRDSRARSYVRDQVRVYLNAAANVLTP